MLVARKSLLVLAAVCSLALVALVAFQAGTTPTPALGSERSEIQLEEELAPPTQDRERLAPTSAVAGGGSGESSEGDAAAPSPAEQVRFTVADESGYPLADATITVSGSGDPVEHPVNAQGVVELPAAAVAEALISATAPGRSVEYAHPSAKPYPAYSFTLPAGSTIRGRLTMVDREPVPEGVHVFATRQGKLDFDDRSLRRRARLGRGMSSLVEHDGSFSIEGLEAGQMYQVSAYGGGVVVKYHKDLGQLIAPVDSLEIDGHYLGAVRFQLDPDSPGRSRFLGALRSDLPDIPRGDPRQPPEFMLQILPKEEIQNLRVVPNNVPGLVVSGLSKEARPKWTGLPDYVFIAAKSRAEAAFKGELHWDLPFTETAITKFTTGLAVRKASIPIALVSVPELPSAWSQESMGSLEIALRAPWLQTGPTAKRLEPRVRMRPTSGPHGESLTLASTWDRSAAEGQGAFVVQDAPAGSYETWLFEGSCGASFPSRQGPGWTVTIEPGQRTQVDATDSAIAAVKLELFEVDGEPFERGLSAELLVKETAGRGYMSMAKRTPAFPSAPYLFPLVPVARANRGAGLHVMLHNAFVLPRPSLVSMEGLTAGEVCSVSLTLSPWPK